MLGSVIGAIDKRVSKVRESDNSKYEGGMAIAQLLSATQAPFHYGSYFSPFARNWEVEQSSDPNFRRESGKGKLVKKASG